MSCGGKEKKLKGKIGAYFYLKDVIFGMKRNNSTYMLPRIFFYISISVLLCYFLLVLDNII